jgi:hypothetical protein
MVVEPEFAFASAAIEVNLIVNFISLVYNFEKKMLNSEYK